MLKCASVCVPFSSISCFGKKRNNIWSQTKIPVRQKYHKLKHAFKLMLGLPHTLHLWEIFPGFEKSAPIHFLLPLNIHRHEQTSAVIIRALHSNRTWALVMAGSVSTRVRTVIVTFTLVDVYKQLNKYMLNYCKHQNIKVIHMQRSSKHGTFNFCLKIFSKTLYIRLPSILYFVINKSEKEV